MRKFTAYSWLFAVAAMLGLSTTTNAGDGWCDYEKFDLGEQIFCEDSGMDLGGWIQLGYHSSNDGVFNTHPGSVDMQQFNVYFEKVADGSDCLDFGGRVDVMYGTDAINTQAFGNNPGVFDYQNGWDHGVYGFAMPQLYGEAAYGDLSVKVGHFYTLLGYQVVPATGNFFYSIPYTFNFSEAFTHTGALAAYKVNDDVTVHLGWTLGWDTGFDQFGSGNSIHAGTVVSLTDDLTMTYMMTGGDLGWIGDGYTHSLVFDWKFCENWEYVVQSDLVGVDNSINAAGGHYDTIGLNQYLFYDVCDDVRLGARAEWWKADGISLYEMAYGLNLSLTENMLLRPEVRYNWAAGATQLPGVIPVTVPANATSAEDYRNNTTFGADLVITF